MRQRDLLPFFATGACQWSALPKRPRACRSPRPAHHYFMLWDWDGTLETASTTAASMWRYLRPGRARGEPIACGGDRQPERQGSAKRGAFISTRRASMRARRSRGASATSRRRHTFGHVVERHRSIPPTCRTPRRRPRVASNRDAVRSPSSRPSSPTAANQTVSRRMVAWKPSPWAMSAAWTGWKSLETHRRGPIRNGPDGRNAGSWRRTFAWISRNRTPRRAALLERWCQKAVPKRLRPSRHDPHHAQRV